MFVLLYIIVIMLPSEMNIDIHSANHCQGTTAPGCTYDGRQTWIVCTLRWGTKSQWISDATHSYILHWGTVLPDSSCQDGLST